MKLKVFDTTEIEPKEYNTRKLNRLRHKYFWIRSHFIQFDTKHKILFWFSKHRGDFRKNGGHFIRKALYGPMGYRIEIDLDRKFRGHIGEHRLWARA